MMHVCGHDGHVAALLGVAALLVSLGERLPGNVKLIFQPGEEGAGGALKMIRDGVLEHPKVSAIAAWHGAADLEAGTLWVGPGVLTAQVDDLDLVISRPDRARGAARSGGGCDFHLQPRVDGDAAVRGALYQSLGGRRSFPSE